MSLTFWMACSAVAFSVAALVVSGIAIGRTRAKAPPVVPVSPSLATGPTRYVLSHDATVLYDGCDSDEAYRWHVEMETHPSKYPGRHRYVENGHTRVDRPHTEIQ